MPNSCAQPRAWARRPVDWTSLPCPARSQRAVWRAGRAPRGSGSGGAVAIGAFESQHDLALAVAAQALVSCVRSTRSGPTRNDGITLPMSGNVENRLLHGGSADVASIDAVERLGFGDFGYTNSLIRYASNSDAQSSCSLSAPPHACCLQDVVRCHRCTTVYSRERLIAAMTCR